MFTWMIPPILLLVILPITHTVALRSICLTLAFGYGLWQWRKHSPPSIPCKVSFALWLLLPMMLLPFAVNPVYSIGEIKTEIVLGLIGFIAFFVLTQKIEILRYWLYAIGVGATIISAWGIYHWSLNGVWIEGGRHGGSASFITYVATIAPLGLLGWIMDRSAWIVRRLWMVSIVLLLIAAFLTMQRIASPIILLEALLMIGWLVYRKYLRMSRAIFVFALSAIAVIALGYAQFTYRIGDANAIVACLSQDPRLTKLNLVAEAIIERPLTGFGFGRNAMKHARPSETHNPTDMYWHAHNTILNYGIAMGIPGIAVFLFLFGSLLYRYVLFLCHSDHLISAIGIVGVSIILGVLLRNQVNDMFHRDLSLLFWCVNGALLGFALRREEVLRT